jgi:hypothetical protein
MMLWDFDISGGPWGGWVLLGVAMVVVWGLAVAVIVALFHGFRRRHRGAHQPKPSGYPRA